MSCLIGASLAPYASDLAPHNTSVLSGVSDEGLDVSQRIDSIFSGPEFDPEVEEVVTGECLVSSDSVYVTSGVCRIPSGVCHVSQLVSVVCQW